MKLAEATDLCLSRTDLPPEAIPSLLDHLLEKSIPIPVKAKFLTALAKKGESSAELAAFAAALLPHAVQTGISGTWQGKALLDCCGTGGGGLDLFNVSTGAMFLIAGAGVPVAKHGNRGLTKTSGSSDVLDALGVKINTTPADIKTCLDKAGLCFLFAPAYHPAFKAVAPVRQFLAAESQRTIFNLLGPLLNPIHPEARILGVFQISHLDLFDHALQDLRSGAHLVIHGSHHDGTALGEVSVTGKNLFQGKLRGVHMDISEDFSTPKNNLAPLLVRSPRESARRIMDILENKDKGLARAILIRNAATGLYVQGSALSLEEGVDQATESLDSGKALSCLNHWQELSAKTN